MTAEAIGEVLALGVGVALSPLAIAAVAVMVTTPAGARSAWAFVLGWVVALAAVATVAVLFAEGADAGDSSGPAGWVDVVQVLLGVALLVFAVRHWRGRGEGPDADDPAWVRKLDGIGPGSAIGLAAVFIVKPKNLVLTIAAAVAVAQLGPKPAEEAAALAVFVALGTTGVAIPLAIHTIMGSRGTKLLAGMRDWMVRESSTVISVLALVIGAKLLGDALL